RKVLTDDFVQLRVALCGRRADERKYGLHPGIEQAFPQNALPHHPRRAKEDYPHAVSRASRRSEATGLKRRHSHTTTNLAISMREKGMLGKGRSPLLPPSESA